MGVESLVIGERYVHDDYPNRVVQYAYNYDGEPMGLLYEPTTDGGWHAKRWIGIDNWDAERMTPYSGDQG